jgi:hypothetical protein
MRLPTSIHQRPFIELAHIVPAHFTWPRTEKPATYEIFWVRNLVPAFPKQLLPFLLAKRWWVLRGGLQRAFAGNEYADPEERLDEGPNEQEAAERSLRGLCDTEGHDENAYWCHSL